MYVVLFDAGYASYILRRVIFFLFDILISLIFFLNLLISSDACLVSRCWNGGTCVSDYETGSYTAFVRQSTMAIHVLLVIIIMIIIIIII